MIALESAKIRREAVMTAPPKTVKRGTSLSTRMVLHRAPSLSTSHELVSLVCVIRRAARVSNLKLEAPRTPHLDSLQLETR